MSPIELFWTAKKGQILKNIFTLVDKILIPHCIMISTYAKTIFTEVQLGCSSGQAKKGDVPSPRASLCNPRCGGDSLVFLGRHLHAPSGRVSHQLHPPHPQEHLNCLEQAGQEESQDVGTACRV